MEDFHQRLLQEKQELDDKKAKLSSFLTSSKSEKLEPTALGLLQIQYSVMQTYSDILKTRLSLL